MQSKFKLEGLKAALSVLVNIQTCIDENDTYTRTNGHSFNLHRDFGICWHVFSGTPPAEVGGCDKEYLIPFFEELGYHYAYPVEVAAIVKGMIAAGDKIPDSEVLHALGRKAYTAQRGDMYNPNCQYGQQRIKLLGELIELIENKLDNPDSFL